MQLHIFNKTYLTTACLNIHTCMFTFWGKKWIGVKRGTFAFITFWWMQLLFLEQCGDVYVSNVEDSRSVLWSKISFKPPILFHMIYKNQQNNPYHKSKCHSCVYISITRLLKGLWPRNTRMNNCKYLLDGFLFHTWLFKISM